MRGSTILILVFIPTEYYGLHKAVIITRRFWCLYSWR